HSEQLQLVAVSGAAGSVRRTKPQWQEPCSDGGCCSWLIGVCRWLLCRLTPELSRAAKRLRLECIVRAHASLFRNRFQIERAVALHKENAWRGLIAARSVLIASSRLQQVRTGAEAKLRLTLGRLDVGA